MSRQYPKINEFNVPPMPIKIPEWFEDEGVYDLIAGLLACCAFLDVHAAYLRWFLHFLPDMTNHEIGQSVGNQHLHLLADIVAASGSLGDTAERYLQENPHLMEFTKIRSAGERLLEAVEFLEQVMGNLS